MKTIVCFLSVLLLTFHLHAQNKKGHAVIRPMELVVRIPQLNAGQPLNHLAQELNSFNGMQVEGFCNSEKLLYLRFNADQYYNVMVTLNEAGYPYYIVKDESIQASIAECSERNELFLLRAAEMH